MVFDKSEPSVLSVLKSVNAFLFCRDPKYARTRSTRAAHTKPPTL